MYESIESDCAGDDDHATTAIEQQDFRPRKNFTHHFNTGGSYHAQKPILLRHSGCLSIGYRGALHIRQPITADYDAVMQLLHNTAVVRLREADAELAWIATWDGIRSQVL